MKKYILIFLSILTCLNLNAQCLGEDCSIKGRNKANKEKAIKMTKNKNIGKKRKVRRGGVAYDPFGNNDSKKSNSQGFDPFEAEERAKKNRKKGKAYDPFAASSSTKHRKSRGKANDSWIAIASHEASVESGGYSGWDGGKRGKVRRGKGKPNSSWTDKRSAKIMNGGGIWADGKTNVRNKTSYKRAGFTAGNNWSDVMASTTGEPPTYERVDNTPKSYSDFEGSSISSDITYSNPHQYKYSLYCGSVMNTGSTAKMVRDAADPRPILGAEFAIEWPTVGSKNFHHYFNIPTMGLAFTYLNPGNENYYGHIAAVYPYVNIPFVRSNAVDFYFLAGVGLAYTSQYKNIEINGESIQNPLISLPVTGFFKGGLGLNIRPITDPKSEKQAKWTHYTISAEASWIHLNNGSLSQPNKGLNMLVGQIGLKYNPEDMEKVVRQKAEVLPHYFTLDLMASAGARDLLADDGKYVIGNFNTTCYFQAANIYRIGIGLDAFYDDSFRNLPDRRKGTKYEQFSGNLENCFRAGVCLSNEIVFGRVNTAIDGGYYFYNPIHLKDESWYLRFALKCYITKHFFAVVALKTHGIKADHATLGVGYSIPL